MKFLIFTILFLPFINSIEIPLSKTTIIDIILRNRLPKPTINKEIPQNSSVTEHWIQQRVNHFDPQNTQTFNQRYFINDEFFQPDGPIIFYLHETPYEQGQAKYYLTSGPVHDLANEFNGVIVLPHHRYFDESVVFEELTIENLRFLTVNQALEDLAHLIFNLRSSDSRYLNSSVILVGWDYGASLAIWFSQRYPHLVTGIWASGARLNPQIGHDEPVHYVENVMRRGGEECFARIENGFRQFEEMFANNQSNILRRKFNFCFPLPYTHGDFDIEYFYEIMVTVFYAYAQVYDGFYLDIVCNQLLNVPVENDWEAIGYLYGLLNIPPPLCYPNSVEYQFDYVQELGNTASSEYGFAYAFTYFECANFGFFLNSGNGTSIFGSRFTKEFFAHICNVLFGFTEDQMTENFELFNTIHGGRRPLVRNAYFTVGELYAWIDQTIERDAVHSTSFYEIVPNRSLHTELSLSLFSDDFLELKGRIFAAIRRWLGLTTN
ncbi:hypothetical protein PVAND_016641 [Polypedilum vanderplanki]|uniref:Uncharacterized protein n=1 Tax=Polypedilum vanderplanki TaxID=319348 RepID=A0A9J6BFP5_POLVA|nr:hypothetical protein PVAND_016641 [Polypedilum vanderplanki]